MSYQLAFSEEKNLLLKETRGVSFEDVIEAYKKGKVIDDIRNKTHPNQRMMIVRMKKYIYCVPYVIDDKKKQLFMKTIYASREQVKKYGIKGGKNE